MKKRIRYFLIAIFFLLQLVQPNKKPIEGTPLDSGLKTEKVYPIFQKSCFNCHSNHTEWPIYSYIFPISLFVHHHVNEGREHLNFSNWDSLSNKKKSELADSIVEETEEKEMPLFSYTIIHQNSKLSDEEINKIKTWAEKIEENYYNEK